MDWENEKRLYVLDNSFKIKVLEFKAELNKKIGLIKVKEVNILIDKHFGDFEK